MLILTNFQRFPQNWRSRSGLSGQAIMVNSAWGMLRLSRCADLIIINCDVGLALKLSAFYMLLPFLRRPILGHDMVLRKPMTLKSRLTALPKRFLLSRIDHFSLHFRILDGYHKYFGIGPDRVSYLPSKPNIRFRYEYKVGPDGEYILCFGRSERDYDTFFKAMEMLPSLPGAIPPPNFAQFKKHASRFTYALSALPPNVRVLEDDGSIQSLIRIIEGAHLVILPILASRIAPSGIGTYLNAMLMGKCIIMSNGPGTSDVLTDEALMVPPEDPVALAAMIQRAWEDDDLRRRTALLGQRYSENCGGEPELRQRVLDRAVEVLYSTPTAVPNEKVS
jgi:glycosyltransferase involved in cell wall biosynthesis